MLIPSPGGVARELFENQSELPQEMKDSLDYIDWYCKILEIGYWEERGIADMKIEAIVEETEDHMRRNEDLPALNEKWANELSR